MARHHGPRPRTLDTLIHLDAYVDAPEDYVVSGEEEGFSWSPCCLCGSTLGGERYRVVDRLDLADVPPGCCVDCLYLDANGTLDDATLLAIADENGLRGIEDADDALGRFRALEPDARQRAINAVRHGADLLTALRDARREYGCPACQGGR